MKKIPLILLALTNVCYASFPIAERNKIICVDNSFKTEVEVFVNEGKYSEALLSILYFLIGGGIGFLGIITSIAYESYSLYMISISIMAISAILGLILGVDGIIKKKKGFTLYILGVLFGILGVLGSISFYIFFWEFG